MSDQQLFCLLDTNAIRELGRYQNWDQLQLAWKKNSLTTAWVPSTLVEITGTNLIGEKLTKSLLSHLALSARRLDTLACGCILEDVDQMLWRDIYRIAGQQAPPCPIPKNTRTVRDMLDRFLQLHDPSQIAINRIPDGYRVQYRFGDEDVWDQLISDAFKTHFAEPLVKQWKSEMRLGSNPSPQDLIEEMLKFTDHWLQDVVRRLGIPDDIVNLARERSPKLIQTSWCAGIVEGSYLLGKACGVDPVPVKENDCRDNILGAYLAEAKYIVTNDRRFSERLKKMLQIPGRIITFQDFLKLPEIAL